MKITIPATSATLHSCFSAGQITALRTGKHLANAYHLQIQNTSAQIFYAEKGAAAVIGESAQVDIGKYIEIITNDLKEWRVISASGSIDVVVTQLNT